MLRWLGARGPDGRMAAVLAVLLVASYGYFYEGGGWNQNTRFDLVRAILERQTLSIDAYHENTGDKARVGDHYYMDKAPGASLVALPAAALVRTLQKIVGADVTSTPSIVALSYASTVGAAALPGVVAVVCVFLVALSVTTDRSAALFAALVCGVSTPFWAYATILYGHTLAAGCLMLGFVCALRIGAESDAGRLTRVAAVLGLASGWAVITEFPPASPPAPSCSSAPGRRSRALRRCGGGWSSRSGWVSPFRRRFSSPTTIWRSRRPFTSPTRARRASRRCRRECSASACPMHR